MLSPGSEIEKKERKWNDIPPLEGICRWRDFHVSRKLVCTDSSRVRGREAQRAMDEEGVGERVERGKTESPRGPNLHPAKQPRTTLFDWLPAGLPSTPAPKYIPVFLLRSFIRLLLLFFTSSPRLSLLLLRFCSVFSLSLHLLFLFSYIPLLCCL